MNKEIRRVEHNWLFTTENGEEYRVHEVGIESTVKIEYHEPDGPGDRHYCDIHYEDGRLERFFNIDAVYFCNEAKGEAHE